MIKYSKWIYELGYKAAVKDILSTVDSIQNPKPNRADFNSDREMDGARTAYYERKLLKNFIQNKYDPKQQFNFGVRLDR